MKLSFCTLGCPDWDLDTIAARGRDLGFDGVELRGVAGEHIGPDETPEDRTRIRDLFADAGLEIACIMGYSRFTLPDAEDRAESARALRSWSPEQRTQRRRRLIAGQPAAHPRRSISRPSAAFGRSIIQS